MSESSPTVPGALPGSMPDAAIRVGEAADAAAVATAIEALLVELGGERPSREELEAASRRLAGDPEAGLLLLAEVDGSLVGVLAASWQLAIHVPGRYGTVQDLWVDPGWRGRAVGRELLTALAARAAELGIARLEVGLPKESFAAIEATERFYRSNGFDPLGPRMRRLLR